MRFRILVALARQLGYHFAKVQKMAGDPMHQNFLTFGASFFGGNVNHESISAESHLVEMLLNEDTWYEPFETNLQRKFPCLLNRVKGINDIVTV